jgi:hypothetical protein
MKSFKNSSDSIVYDDLKQTIRKGSRVSVSASRFSMGAFDDLKKELASVSEFRFICTSQAFLNERPEKHSREWYIAIPATPPPPFSLTH